LLTARGLQRYRAIANLVHWVAVGAAAAVLVPRLGNLGWLLSLIIGHAVLFAAYVGKIARRNQRDARTLGLTALIIVAFVPVLMWH
jgi:O-antigen/teichoic acid export membrane protein